MTLPGRKAGKQAAEGVARVPVPEKGMMGTVAALVQPRDGEVDGEGSREGSREGSGEGSAARERKDAEPFRWRRRYSWAELMKRVFRAEVLTCPDCGGSRRLLAFILEPLAIARILRHLGLPTELPNVHPARASPEQEQFGFAE